MIVDLLKKAVELRASDIHISAGYPILVRVDGDLISLDDKVLTSKEAFDLISETLKERVAEEYKKNLEVDYAYNLESGERFRVNVYSQSRGIAGAFRYISSEIPTFEDIMAPEVFKKISQLEKGLILVTGPTGSGKTTSLASMLNDINKNTKKHIITIEDPIEYIYKKEQCLVNQRELNSNTKSFSNALRSALREDPDVILVGEMRDLETIRLALTAADTGHVVFSTLHTSTASSTISRIIDAFDGSEKNIVRSVLAESLQAVICQRLLKKKGDEGRVGAFEILLANHAVRNLIREDKAIQLENVMQTGGSEGMQSFDRALDNLRSKGLID